MFFLVALISTLGYSLQSSLMTSYYRRIDRLSAVAFRGLSLGITMLPLLLFVSRRDFARLGDYIGPLAAASLIAVAANWCMANAYSHLPLGIASALTMSFTALMTVVVGYFAFSEAMSLLQLFFIALILAGVLFLGASRSKGRVPAEYNVRLGILNSLAFGLLIGVAFALIGSVSRKLDPFLAGYCWELTIGLMAGLTAAFRGLLGRTFLHRLSLRDALMLTLYCAPTAVGTSFFALATTMGPIGIVSAIMSLILVCNTLLAIPLYKEKLSATQWLLLLFVCCMIAGLRLSSS